MVETLEELIKACPISIPALNSHFQANQGTQIIIEARQQNQDLPDLQIISNSLQLFKRLKPSDKGITQSEQSPNKYGDATVVVRIQILATIYEKILKYENREEVDLMKFNEILADFEKEYVGLLQRIKYKVQYEMFMRAAKNLQENQDEQDRNHIYLRYYDLIAEEMKMQESKSQPQQENKKQNDKKEEKEKQQKEEQIELKNHQKQAQQQKDPENKGHESPEQVVNNKEDQKISQGQAKKEEEVVANNGSQQKQAKVLDDDDRVGIVTENNKKQEKVPKKQLKQSKKEDSQSKLLPSSSNQNGLLSFLQKYLEQAKITQPHYKQSVLDYKISLNPNKISKNHPKITLISELIYSHSQQQVLQYASNTIGSGLVEAENGDTFLVIQIQEGKQNIEFVKVDLDMMLSELVNEHMSLGIKTQINQKKLSVIFPAPFVNSLQNLINSLNAFTKIFSHFESPYFKPILSLSFSHINKSFIPSLLHGFNANINLKCNPKVYATLQKNIEQTHQEQGISNKLLLLLFAGFNQNLELKFKGIQEIDRFLKKMGLQKQKTMLNSVLIEEIFGDLIMKNQWKQNKILNPILKLLIEKSESLSFFLLHQKKMAMNVKIESASLKNLFVFQ